MIGDLPFKEVWFCDFEFIARPGARPDVICCCASELRSGRTVQLWEDQLGAEPPYSIGDNAVLICFAATAECACHLALGWPLPRNVIDISPMFRSYINGRAVPTEGKSLLGALGHFGFKTIGQKYKDAMRNRILQGRPYSAEEKEKILRYCSGDIEQLPRLLEELLPHFALGTVLHWGEFAAVSAVMEHRGVPINAEIFSQLQDKQTWSHIRDALVPKLNQQYGVYTIGLDGAWHFNVALFEQYLGRVGIEWPRHIGTDKLDLRAKTFDSMASAYPELESLRQLRHTHSKMRRVKLAVGDDHRNRTTLWPFASKTGRSQPKASQWIFSPAVWLRTLIKPAPGMAVAYLDWSAMEFQVAAALSDCRPMLDLYATGQPYIEFAKRFDEAPPTATKHTHDHIHQRYKVGCLGAQYSMQHVTLAQRLGISTLVASEMLNQHRGLFAAYWHWVEDWIAHALDTGSMRTALGWTCQTGITEFNARSIGNWPTQSSGADILRVSCVWAHRRGIKLCGSVHDAVLIESPIDRIDADVMLMREIMRRASRIVLGNGRELRTSKEIIKYPDSYSDSRGVKIWSDVIELLAQYRQQQETRDEDAASA
ncbi:hypothetical protein HAP47_0001480 [Bradyrhizobium sp. 41S5]|uniref:DNA polymerase n=1 Tax=Bradyrhizobium sp. 41S5 TaxID=1404443 RepID=UPI00156AB95D|nr:DNA polymerase [Bradyrhizobium sp. 41S5]UFX45431.1 hypothetical protein HAP47_0001480 [Bradyrhizobium sp. 41S5]